MARASSQRLWRPGWTRALLLAGLFLALQLAQAAPPGSTDKSTGKGTTTKAKAPAFKMVPAPDAASDVAEMSRVINEKIEASWKANKVEPSAYIDDYDFIRRATLDIV